MPTSKGVPGVLSALWGQVPSNMRLYAESLVGKESPITEADFSESDLEALRSTVRTASERGSKDYFSYHDYPVTEDPQHGAWWDTVKSSFTDPSFRGQTSVGQGNYHTDPEGNTIATDTYDWNSAKQAAELPIGDKLALIVRSLRDPLEIGNLMGNITGGSRPTRINLGNLK